MRGQTVFGGEVRERVGLANQLLCQTTDDEKFVTLLYGVLDPAAHSFTYTSAGHDPALVYRADGGRGQLTSSGVALGVLEECPYDQEMVPLAPGDLIVVYSDGVTDATNAGNEAFGLDRLERVVEATLGNSAEQVVESVFAAVEEHAGGEDQFDDLTVVVIRRSP